MTAALRNSAFVTYIFYPIKITTFNQTPLKPRAAPQTSMSLPNSLINRCADPLTPLGLRPQQAQTVDASSHTIDYELRAF